MQSDGSADDIKPQRCSMFGEKARGDFIEKDMGDYREQVLDQEHRESLAPEKEALSLPIKKGTLIGEHMNNYTKLLADLANVDVMIEDEDKTLILLSSLLTRTKKSLFSS